MAISLRLVFSAALLAASLTSGVLAKEAAPATPGVPAQAPQEPEKPATVDAAELLKPGPLPENILGKDDAPVTIVEYASLSCSHCANFHTKTFPMLKRDYIETGKVRLVFRDFPFDMVAMAGTMISRCAPKEKFFDLTATLFEQQQQWAFGNDPEKALRDLAYANGFTQESFDACLQRQDIYDGVIEVRRRGYETFSVDSTPTLIVNGVVYRGALSPAQMEAAIKPFLEKK